MAAGCLLPEYISDILPYQAKYLERLRREILDMYDSYGYELVIPPSLEYLESLLVATGSDLDLRTFKLVDQMSGKTMGLRADMTPQIARIDACLLNKTVTNRLCYCGAVMHTLPSSLNSHREIIQIGAEMYGESTVYGDLEILQLMVQSLMLCKLEGLYVTIGHCMFVPTILASQGFSNDEIAFLRQALHVKDLPYIEELSKPLPASVATVLHKIGALVGQHTVLEQAKALLSESSPDHINLLDDIIVLINYLEEAGIQWGLDLTDRGSYRYHTGIVFTAYHRHFPAAVASGGRYDAMKHGDSRPATGFSIDLRSISAYTSENYYQSNNLVYAPYSPEDRLLQATIIRLRAQGVRVVCGFPLADSNEPRLLNCHAVLKRVEDQWHLEKIE